MSLDEYADIIFQNYMKECENLPPEKKQSPTEIIIKDPVITVKDNNVKAKKLPKPENLEQYIGQEENKNAIRTTLKIINEVKPINIFVHGLPGTGKTTISEIIAKELKAEFIYTIPEQLKDVEKITEVLNTIQTNENLTVWMIDEVHTIDRKLINILLPILQDGRLGDVNIKPFVLIGATTDYNKIYKKSEALISRFQTKINLTRYTEEEIVKILKQYKSQMNVNVSIPEEDYICIAKNSKLIPREAINLLLKRLVLSNMCQILLENKIIKNGLNDVDVRILKCLAEMEKPIGSNFLSQRAGLIESDYLLIYEPYLIEMQYIDRTNRGRVINKRGKDFLNEINI